MNKKLKAQIFLKYGTQADFVEAIKEHATIISMVVSGRRQLNPERQRVWAEALNCKTAEIF